jgi:hypothetical protein
MIYGVVAKNDTDVLQSYLMPGLDQHGIKCCIASDDFEGQHQSIFIKYNQSIEALIKDGLKQDDVVIFVHEDVKLLDPNLVPKLEMLFKEKQDLGLTGVAGTSELSDTCRWWSNDVKNMRGHLIQENKQQSYHLVKGIIGYSDDLVVVDGVFLAIRGKLLLDGLKFDDKSYDGFHFYDLDICLQVLEMKYKIGVTDILILHKSVGDISKNDDWSKNKDIFFQKWSENHKFPFSANIFLHDNIKEIEV